MKRLILFHLAVLAVFLLSSDMAALAGDAPALPPARKVPGINAEDLFPNGCVDCHVVRKDINRDVRISTIINRWIETVEPKFVDLAQSVSPPGVKLIGRHPDISRFMKDIPSDCLACHASTSKTAPSLEKMMHLYHLVGGDENPFMTVFQGECTHCHKLNKDTGHWSVPNGREK